MIEGFEADDVIGTLAKRAAAKEHFAVTIVTADKDFMQLVGPHVTLWDTMRDRRIGAREVRERFGVEPSALVDIQALTGDTIDNIKGVPGVGEKTATALIRNSAALEGLYANLDRIEGVRDSRREESRGRCSRSIARRVELARKLVRIETDVPLEVDARRIRRGMGSTRSGGASCCASWSSIRSLARLAVAGALPPARREP